MLGNNVELALPDTLDERFPLIMREGDSVVPVPDNYVLTVKFYFDTVPEIAV